MVFKKLLTKYTITIVQEGIHISMYSFWVNTLDRSRTFLTLKNNCDLPSLFSELLLKFI